MVFFPAIFAATSDQGRFLMIIRNVIEALLASVRWV